jgi:hypothetical protein
MHLWCKFYVSRPLFDAAQLDVLQSVINETLPQWSSELRVAMYEHSRKHFVVGRQARLFDGVHQVAPPKQRFGCAVLTGAYKNLSFFLDHCESRVPVELNKMAVEVYGPFMIEGQATSAWARGFFEAIAAQLPVRYGNARTSEEYDAKNMVDDETGAYAIGANVNKAIPGLYWLNYFGGPYVDLIGRERLLSAPAYDVKPVGDGVLIALDSSAESWQSEPYVEREQAVINHLGPQYFFSRLHPDRQMTAPNFAAYRDRPAN